MSSVTTDTALTTDTDGGGYDSDSLIDFTVYYDENGNLVTADGYLLDADGNLVVSADSELTGAYSVVGADGETYYVGEDATIVNGAILSSVDSDQASVIVDDYGNAVDSDGYILDQSDSDGATRLTVESDYSIDSRTTAEATDSDGNAVTITAGTTYTFVDADSDAGTVYVTAKASSTEYYDSYGNSVTSGGLLADSDGTVLSVSASQCSTETTYTVTYSSATYYYAVSATTTGSTTYYAIVDVSVSHLYLAGTQLTDDDYVYSSGTTYYLLDAENPIETTFTFTSDTTIETGISTFLVSDIEMSDVANDEYVYISATTSGSYYAYYGGYSTNELDGFTKSVTIGSTVYYFQSATGSSSTGISASVLSSVLGYTYAASLPESDGPGGYSLADYYTIGGTAASETSSSSYSLTLNLYAVTATASALYADASGTTSVTVSSETGNLKGWQLYVDANGQWVTATQNGGTIYYLASTTASSILDVRLTTTTVATSWGYTIDGVTFLSQQTYSDSDTAVSDFASSVDSDATVYTSAAGFSLDADGYIVDEAGEKQLLTAETLFTYTQKVEDTDSDGNGLGTYSYYYYYFGSTDGSDYYDSDAGITDDIDDDGEDETVYELLTGVRGTIYYDANGNTVNAAGYLMDATTFDLIYTSATELTAGYSFTSIDGITYIVSGQATVDTVNGTFIVYSGVYETRYYGDANGNEYLDDYDTEYTSDALWIIIRDDAGDILSYQSVEDETNVLTAQEYEDQYGSSATATATATSATATVGS